MNNAEIQRKMKSIKGKIEKWIEDGCLKEAMKALDDYEAMIPGDPEIYSMRAVIHIIEGSFDKAEAVLEKGLEKDTVQFDLLFNLAYIRELEGKAQDAADLYGKAETVAYEASQKQNVGQAIDRIKAADGSVEIKERARIVFFVKAGMNNFFEDIIIGISNNYWVRKITVSEFKQIDEGMEWADICWFEWCDDLVEYGSKLPLVYQKKVICRLHRYEVFTEYPGKVNWANVDTLIIVTEHLRGLLETNFPGIIDKVKTIVIENGVDVNRYPFKKRTNGFNLAMVGYIHSRKNPALLLQIIEKLVRLDKRYKLYVAGQFQEQVIKLYWDYQVRRMGLEKNVIFDGWQKDISTWLEDKNYLLSASIHESFGYGIAEAMSRGIKPVIHDFLYANDIWGEEFLFNTVDGAVEAISRGRYESEQYRAFIENNYSLKKQLWLTNDLFKELLSFKDMVGGIKDIISGAASPQELMREDITVLIPSYNRAKMMKEDMDKGLKLGKQPKLIVDDCSTEETQWLEVISRDFAVSGSKLVRADKNGGVAESRRLGLDAIKTEYATFVDDDNMMVCLDRTVSNRDILQLKHDVSIVVPRYIINYYTDRLSLGYDRQHYNEMNGAQVLRELASSGEMMGLLTGGAIGETQWMSEHSSCPLFRVGEDYVMLCRMMASKPEMKLKTTEGLVFIRRFLDEGLTLSPNSFKLMLALLAQAIACYYCLQLGVADKDEVMKWMKDRAALIQQLYDFGESFETELIAYLKGEISEEVFVHFIALHGLKLENGLDELAPELRMMRAMFYTEPIEKKWFDGMKDLPLVSIIIPTFNRIEMLKKAIDQALKQDYPNIEVIVTDNASEDGTEEMVRSRYKDEKRLIYHRNETNIGPVLNAMNGFYNLSSGKYCMMVFDDDYIIDSMYTSSAVELLERRPDVVYVFGGVYHNSIIDESINKVISNIPEVVSGDDYFVNFKSKKYPIMPSINTIVFRRDIAVEYRCLQSLPNAVAGDMFFQLRMLLHGNVGFINKVAVAYNLHIGSMSRNLDNRVVSEDDSGCGKAVATAVDDIKELGMIHEAAVGLYGFDRDIMSNWLANRTFNYLYWRFNETVQSKQETMALLKFVKLEHGEFYKTFRDFVNSKYGMG